MAGTSSFLIAILVAGWVFPCLGQNGVATHDHMGATVIDGAQHPESIPDITAYRLFFVIASRPAIASENEKRHQAAQLARIGLENADGKTLTAVLADFDSLYRTLIDTFNEEAAADWARGESPNQNAFLLQRDQIVQSTLDTLRARLSSDGFARLQQHVKGEKKHMKLSVTGGGQ